jgi:hypothetical protein
MHVVRLFVQLGDGKTFNLNDVESSSFLYYLSSIELLHRSVFLKVGVATHWCVARNF